MGFPPSDARFPAGSPSPWQDVAITRKVVKFIGLQGKKNNILDLGQVYFLSP